MRRLMAAAAVLALTGAAAAAVWAAGDCRPLDRLFGRSGCVGSFEIASLASLRQTLAFDPARPHLLYAAGVSYQGYSSGDRLKGQSTIVALDASSGAERWRSAVDPNGTPERLVLSPDGSRAALSCNRLATCDFAPNVAPRGEREHYAPVSVIDLAKVSTANNGGERVKAQWMRPVAFSAMSPDADGRSAVPRFSADGQTIAANGAFWTLAGEAALQPANFAPELGGWDTVSAQNGAIRASFERLAAALVLKDAGGAEIRRMALDLPSDFEPALHAPLALSPEGTRIAVLLRRFSGPGETRAILQVFRLSDGARLARVTLEVDVSPAVVFSPDGRRVLAATSPEPGVMASTTVRIYPAGDDT